MQYLINIGTYLSLVHNISRVALTIWPMKNTGGVYRPAEYDNWHCTGCRGIFGTIAQAAGESVVLLIFAGMALAAAISARYLNEVQAID